MGIKYWNACKMKDDDFIHATSSNPNNPNVWNVEIIKNAWKDCVNNRPPILIIKRKTPKPLAPDGTFPLQIPLW